jgi:hypothetical protein
VLAPPRCICAFWIPFFILTIVVARWMTKNPPALNISPGIFVLILCHTSVAGRHATVLPFRLQLISLYFTNFLYYACSMFDRLPSSTQSLGASGMLWWQFTLRYLLCVIEPIVGISWSCSSCRLVLLFSVILYPSYARSCVMYQGSVELVYLSSLAL